MNNLFPIIQPEEILEQEELPIAKEIAWDFEKGQPLWVQGTPVIVTGKEAVKVWLWKALMTPRAKHGIYSFQYGDEIYTLIGQNYTPELKTSEAVRYAKETALPNPYITDVSQVEVDFQKDTLFISVIVNTIYGEVELDARANFTL